MPQTEFRILCRCSYQKLLVDEPTGLAMRETQGAIYYLGEEETPLPLQADRACLNLTNINCTYPSLLCRC